MKENTYVSEQRGLRRKIEKYYNLHTNTYPALEYEIPGAQFNGLRFYLMLEIEDNLYYGVTTKHGKQNDPEGNNEHVKTYVRTYLTPETCEKETEA